MFSFQGEIDPNLFPLETLTTDRPVDTPITAVSFRLQSTVIQIY